ncbi:helix-turn-helix domain-containing protein [Rubrobacter aplysinae]|uniref:helix-turn-helix domain-containing protein n=1 Tax=Rubrobacter aplysinae TaxID=909625 RepID=UPI00064BD907
MNEKIEPTWLTYEEAGRLVGLGRTTLWRLARNGDIKTARVGRAVRIERQSLEAYLRLQARDFEVDNQKARSLIEREGVRRYPDGA